MDLHHLQLGGDEVENFGDVLAHQPQRAAAIGAEVAGIERDGLARGVRGDAGLAAPPLRRDVVGRGGLGGGRLLDLRRVRLGCRIGGGARGLEALKRQFQLREFTLDLLRTRTEALLLQLRDGDPERLDQGVIGPVGGLDPGDLRPKAEHHGPQNRRIFGKGFGLGSHGRMIRDAGAQFHVKSLIRSANHTTRAGGDDQAGRRQSIPSHSIDSCAEVSRSAVPSACEGHGKRPFSSTL